MCTTHWPPPATFNFYGGHIMLFLRTLVFAGLVSIAGSLASYGQCNSDQHTDEGAVGIGADGTIYDRYSSAYQFEMYYSESSTIYLVTEPMRNDEKLRWSDWCLDQKITDLTAEELSAISHTEPFTVQTGDAVTLYRELCWRDENGRYFPGSYFSRDDLDYAVEIADPATGERIALLDSIGLPATVPADTPELHGTAANAALLTWTVPEDYDGETVVIGIHLYVRGDGTFNPGRYDHFTVNMSDRLTDTDSQAGIINPVN